MQKNKIEKAQISQKKGKNAVINDTILLIK